MAATAAGGGGRPPCFPPAASAILDEILLLPIRLGDGRLGRSKRGRQDYQDMRPKRHQVASLSALSAVHRLARSRSNMPLNISCSPGLASLNPGSILSRAGFGWGPPSACSRGTRTPAAYTCCTLPRRTIETRAPNHFFCVVEQLYLPKNSLWKLIPKISRTVVHAYHRSTQNSSKYFK